MSRSKSPGQNTLDEDEYEDAEMVDVEDKEDDDDEEEEFEPGAQHGSKEIEGQDHYRQPRENRKDKDLNTFLDQMDKYAPIIPDAVTDYYLSLAGFECNDQRIKRLLALCTQKFISDLATDAFQFSKIRSSTSASAGPVPQVGPRIGRPGKDRGRNVLTLEDLSAALGDGGINIKRPDFYR